KPGVSKSARHRVQIATLGTPHPGDGQWERSSEEVANYWEPEFEFSARPTRRRPFARLVCVFEGSSEDQLMLVSTGKTPRLITQSQRRRQNWHTRPPKRSLDWAPDCYETGASGVLSGAQARFSD